MVYKHAVVAAFMLSVVQMLLKWKVGDRALNSHGNYIVDHGKILDLCFRFSVGTLSVEKVNISLIFRFSDVLPIREMAGIIVK